MGDRSSVTVNDQVHPENEADEEKGVFYAQSDAYRTVSGKDPTKRPPQDLKWTHVNFTVGKTNILTDCWGEVPAGKVCAIMGPSGAGKSSLLNVLAGRSSSGGNIKISGNVSVARNFINPQAFRNNIAYVMQDDALMATATPREALKFSANMRLPASTPSDEIEALVKKVLSDLGLEECADTLIGGPLIKGISGGQRKRTSVGVEIITHPALLFLDEPTSGLDSFAAFNCVKLLKKVAETNCAVLCTIHQPSSEVFFLFDIVILMKAGRILYNGPVDSIVTFFEGYGFNCPKNYNPADYSMFVCQSESIESMESKHMFMNYKTDGESKKVRGDDDQLLDTPGDLIPKVRASFARQLYSLTAREWINTYRDIAALIGRFGVTIFLNILFGLIFYNSGGKDDSNNDNFSAHFGALTMITIASMFGSAQPVMLQFPFERPMFLREYATGTYGAPAYFISKAILELPLCFIQTLSQYIIVYFLCNFQGNFILMVLAAWGLGIASSSMAVALGCAVADVKDVTELAPLLYVPQLLFAGFFIKTSQIPIYLRWAQYTSGLKYAMNLLILTEFDNSLPSCQDGASDACHSVISNNNIERDMWWLYIVILVILFFALRVLGGIILVQKAKKFY